VKKYLQESNFTPADVVVLTSLIVMAGIVFNVPVRLHVKKAESGFDAYLMVWTTEREYFSRHLYIYLYVALSQQNLVIMVKLGRHVHCVPKNETQVILYSCNFNES